METEVGVVLALGWLDSCVSGSGLRGRLDGLASGDKLQIPFSNFSVENGYYYRKKYFITK
jgi:hypothetical protein